MKEGYFGKICIWGLGLGVWGFGGVWAGEGADPSTLEPLVIAGRDLSSLTVDELWTVSDEYWHDGDYESCIRIHRRIVQMEPDFTEAYGTGAWLLWSLGRREEAIDFLKQGIAANPNVYDVYAELGQHYLLREKDAAAALPYLEQAVRFEPPPLVGRSLAHAYRLLGRHSEALALWDRLRQQASNPLFQNLYLRALNRALQSDARAVAGGVVQGPPNPEQALISLRVEEQDADGDGWVERKKVFYEDPEDQDGEPDYLFRYEDLNYDGLADGWRWMVTDADDDGEFDFDSDIWVADTDRDGYAEVRQEYLDYDGDGEAEASVVFPNLNGPDPFAFSDTNTAPGNWQHFLMSRGTFGFGGWTGRGWQRPEEGTWWNLLPLRGASHPLVLSPLPERGPGAISPAQPWIALRATLLHTLPEERVVASLGATRGTAWPVLWQGYAPPQPQTWEFRFPTSRFLFGAEALLYLRFQRESGEVINVHQLQRVAFSRNLVASPAMYEIGAATLENPLGAEMRGDQWVCRPPVFISSPQETIHYELILRDLVTGRETRVFRRRLPRGVAVYNSPQAYGGNVAKRGFEVPIPPKKLVPARWYTPVQRLRRGEAVVDEKILEGLVLVRNGDILSLAPRPGWREFDREVEAIPEQALIRGQVVALLNLAGTTAETPLSWAHTGPRGLSRLKDFLEGKLGLDTRSLARPLTPESLSGVKVLIVAAPTGAEPLTGEEVEVVLDWQSPAHGMLLLGGPPRHCNLSALNPLALRLELFFSHEEVSNTIRNGQPALRLFPLSPRFPYGPGALQGDSACSLRLRHPERRLLIVNGRAIMAYGRNPGVVAVGTPWCANAALVEADNKVLTRNVLLALAAAGMQPRMGPGGPGPRGKPPEEGRVLDGP